MEYDRLALALDRASSRIYDQDGHLHVVATPISKATVNPYYGREIPGYEALGLDANRIYQLLRHPDELAKAADTFNGKPLLDEHKPATAQDHPRHLTAGSLANTFWDAPYLKSDISVWDGESIENIDRNEKRQLSSSYRYRADMTPGSFQGVRYDGVMRDIVGNHVALVKEGRAGPDVMVGDSITGMFSMTPTVLTRKAALVQGALVARLQPMLAQDAKIDLTPMLKGVTAENFKAKKPAIAAGLAKATKGKLAQDADLDDVVKMLDVLDEMTPEEVEQAEEKAEEVAADAEPEKKGADVAKDADKDDEDDKKDKDVKAAQDAALAAATKDMVSKTAMDAAIATAVEAATSAAIRTQREIREAERFVEPWVGQLALAHDSAPDVYRSALKVLKVDGADKLHADALRPVLQAQPKPGENRARPVEIAQDAASVESFDKMFPHANRLK